MSDQAQYWDRLAAHPPDASVIDPNDQRGFKNRYIAGIRDRAIVDGVPATSRVLDFGCGTGSLSRALTAAGATVVGVDISLGLLRRTRERQLGPQALFLQYDGGALPLCDASFHRVSTYVVLTHFLEDAPLLASLKELHRVLAPGGKLLAIEQARWRRRIDHRAWQCRRTRGEWRALLAAAGFRLEAERVIRYGHMPSTYLVRMGWIPERWYPTLARWEQRLGRILGVPPLEYCDVLFEASRY